MIFSDAMNRDIPDLPEGALLPELLAPAGNWECARAAVSNGADAIYFGLDRFNARLRADNFTLADLPALMLFLHAHGVKGYVTMNTLIFSREMEDAFVYLAELNDAGVDGVIVQDMGLARQLTLWKRENPSITLELHASTQMTLTSPEGMEFAEGMLDLDRAVLARELSLEDIDACAERPNVPLEVFVHGALCVSYSGQCLTSESLGRRSANRGECAQACRMPYELIVDGKFKPMGERRYLLSPQDLCAIDRIADLVAMGVKSYKIEGRLKSPAYVAAVTAAYRKALNAAAQGIPASRLIAERDRYALQMVFSRGFSTGWLDGPNHPQLTHGRHGKKRGAYVGMVKECGSGWVDVELEGRIPLSPGDGFVFDAGEDRNEEQGGRIWKVQRNRLFFHGKAGNIDWKRVKPGQKLWKTDDPVLNAELKKTWEHTPEISRSIALACRGSEGEPLQVECPEFGVSVFSSHLLVRAEKRPLTEEVLAEQLGRLGGTGWKLKSCQSELQEELMLPLSELNRMRRELVEELDRAAKNQIQKKTAPRILPSILPSVVSEEISREEEHRLSWSVLCRRPSQIAASIESGADELYLDFEDIREYREGVEEARRFSPSVSVFLATPRIQKPKESGFFKLIERAEPDGVLVRNLGAAGYFRSSPLRKRGDFSLNAANPWAAQALMEAGGLECLAISCDLNVSQVMDLLAGAPPAWFELVLHQHMPMFHMEHCVFCTFLSEGSNYKNCGRPCERHQVGLRDRVGQIHPLAADAGCRNTVFNGKGQTGALFFHELKQAGLRRFRIDLLHEEAEEAARIIESYRALQEGRLSPRELVGSMGLADQLGTTKGD